MSRVILSLGIVVAIASLSGCCKMEVDSLDIEGTGLKSIMGLVSEFGFVDDIFLQSGGLESSGFVAFVDDSDGASVESDGFAVASQSGSVGGSNASTGSAGGGASSAAPSAPSAPAHQHSWTYHEAVTEQVWVPNQVYVPRYTCGTCGFNGFDIPTMNAHQEASGRGGCGAYYTSGYYEDQGYYETRTVSNAYYSCSCGATK